MMIYPSISIPVTIGGELTSDMVLINKLKLKAHIGHSMGDEIANPTTFIFALTSKRNFRAIQIIPKTCPADCLRILSAKIEGSLLKVTAAWWSSADAIEVYGVKNTDALLLQKNNC